MGVVVEVEVDYSQGMPGMTIVGLPDGAVQESRERVQAAVRNAGVPYPRKRLGVLPASAAEGTMLVGELSLDGTVHHARGVLPADLAKALQYHPRALMGAG